MKQLKFLIPLIALCLLLGTGRASAQWTVIDPSNIAQSIVNNSKSLVQESQTATHMVKNFQETVKIYQQAKKYYDALQSVNNLVRDARKVQQTILMLGNISGYYVNNFQKMLTDPNFTSAELSAIASGYTRILEEANGVLGDLKQVVNITTLSMTDKDRMDVVDDCYKEMKRLKNLTAYYTCLLYSLRRQRQMCIRDRPRRKPIQNVWWLSMATALKNTGDAYAVFH